MYARLEQRPYVEFHEGRKVLKVSPDTRHSIIQVTLSSILHGLAKGRGRVGTEWHFDMTLQLGTQTIVLPDIAFVRRERLFGLSDRYLQIPNFAPDVAIEIRSQSDRPGRREWNVARYLEAGSMLVLDVQPERRIIRGAAPGMDELTFGPGETFAHPAVPWLRFKTAEAFADLDPI